MQGTIYVILGRRGGGKSCLMTYLGYQDHLSGITIVSNYHLNFPHVYMTFEEIARLPKSLKNATVLLDEGQVGADSREIFKPSNKAMGTLATQLRKLNVNLFITTQIFGQIDKRLRDQTDYVIYIQALDRNNPEWFKFIVQDWFTKEWIKDWQYFYGKPYFSLYDTYQVIRFSEDDEDETDEIEKQIELLSETDLEVT